MTRAGRRTLALVAALAITGAAGCGSNEESGGGSTAEGEIAEAPGFDGQTIRLGVLSPLSGPVAVIGQPLTSGNQVFFDQVNADGGIAGKYQVELVQEDTQYAPDITVQRYNRIKDDVAAFTQVLGTAPTLALLPQLARDEMIAAPASLDAFWVREPNLLPVGAPYQIQAINALNFYLEQEGEDKRICSLLQDDVYGEAGQQGLEFGAEEAGVDIVETQRYKAGDKDVTGQIQQLRQARCDMVFYVGLPQDAGTVWGTAARMSFAPRWIGTSPVWIDELGKSPLAEYLQQTTWIAAEGTEWGDDSVPGMKEMVADVEEFKPNQEPDYYFAFGYNQGRAMTALLEKAVELGDLSREGLMAASEELGTVSFEGLQGDYTYGPAEDRDPPRATTIFKVAPDQPFGLATEEYNYSTDAARQFQFERADL